MKVRQAGIECRAVVQAYAAYDCSKKLRPVPDFAAWDWSNADAIDQQMLSVELKIGILGGYHLWDMVEICLSDLGECAVLADIFPGPTRALRLLERAGRLASWMPPHRTGWYDDIVGGQALDQQSPLILRLALTSERPASWYIEDGSGRAIALLSNRTLFDSAQAVGIAYVGRVPDRDSGFMQRAPSCELLGNQSAGSTSWQK